MYKTCQESSALKKGKNEVTDKIFNTMFIASVMHKNKEKLNQMINIYKMHQDFNIPQQVCCGLTQNLDFAFH